jgi:prepilin-type N-terminal cleavage/methylation domain-containing protein
MNRRAFTLVELLVAVVVLLAVIVATSKVFTTASKVTSMGEATADVVQQAGVIEEQLRRDFSAITQNGYIAIQCVAVRNDVNRVITGLAAAPLLNPELAANAVIRADTMVFFTTGTESTARWSGPNDTSAYGGNQQSRAARVFYGHGVQLPGLGNDPAGSGAGQVKPIIQGMAPASAPQQILPWTWKDPSGANPPQVRWISGTSNQASSNMPRISPNQPGAREWVLCRKSVLLADDGGRVLFYPDPAPTSLGTVVSSTGPGTTSVPSVFGDRSYTSPSGTDAASMYMELRGRGYTPQSTNLVPSATLQSGWVDIAASELDEIRRLVAPTLPLTNPVTVPATAPNVTLTSMSTPWVAQPNDTPMGWPIGTSSVPFPWGSSVTGPNFPTAPGTVGSYTSQRDRIARGTFGPLHLNGGISAAYNSVGLLAWPRAEKSVPNSDRRSEVLASPVLLNNCSHFQIDWTWSRGTGLQTDLAGNALDALENLGGNTGAVMRGFEPDAGAWNGAADDFIRVPRPQPWFGFPDTGDGGVVPQADQRYGVTLAQDLSAMPDFAEAANSPNTTNLHMRRVVQGIEGIAGNAAIPAISAPFGAGVPVRVYTAIFGFNQDEAYVVTPDGLRVLRDDYTPWPTQIRFTMTLHDPRLVLERGREFQFVLDLPRRGK